MAHSRKNKDDISWLDKLRNEVTHQAEEVPEGWHTVKEMAEKLNLSDSQTRKIVFKGIEMGSVETRKFRIKTAQRSYPVPHYRNKE